MLNYTSRFCNTLKIAARISVCLLTSRCNSFIANSREFSSQDRLDRSEPKRNRDHRQWRLVGWDGWIGTELALFVFINPPRLRRGVCSILLRCWSTQRYSYLQVIIWSLSFQGWAIDITLWCNGLWVYNFVLRGGGPCGLYVCLWVYCTCINRHTLIILTGKGIPVRTIPSGLAEGGEGNTGMPTWL